VQKAYTRKEQVINADWKTIAEFLTTFNQCETKDEMQLFNLWQFDENGEQGRKRIYENGEPTENYEEVAGTIRRCKANAELCYGLILDYDGETRIDNTIKELAGFAYAYYTSFRHSEETNKYRIVLPFRKGVSSEYFKRKKEALSQVFEKVDHASFSESQSFYLHSGKDVSIARSGWFEGEFLDLELFADTIQPIITYTPKDFNPITASDLERVLNKLQKYYPNPDYNTWLTIIFAVANEVGDNAAIPLLQRYWPERRNGEYAGKLFGRPASGKLTIGTLYFLIRKYEPQFAIKEQPKTSIELKEAIIKKWGTGNK